MGRTRHEIPSLRKAGDHPARRALPFAGAPHAGETRHSKSDLLPLVRSLSHWRARSPGRSLAPAGSRLEPDPRHGARADHQARARRAGAFAARTHLGLPRWRVPIVDAPPPASNRSRRFVSEAAIFWAGVQ